MRGWGQGLNTLRISPLNSQELQKAQKQKSKPMKVQDILKKVIKSMQRGGVCDIKTAKSWNMQVDKNNFPWNNHIIINMCCCSSSYKPKPTIFLFTILCITTMKQSENTEKKLRKNIVRYFLRHGTNQQC